MVHFGKDKSYDQLLESFRFFINVVCVKERICYSVESIQRHRVQAKNIVTLNSLSPEI